jgi:prepilin-type N-terminal cleavage/methylation domain-containing protein
MYVAEDSTPRRGRSADGFTLIELIITVAIMGIMVIALTGVVISYLKTTNATEGRLTESHDVQFASAYWQRDVASIGVRSTSYDSSATVHSFPLLQSVGVTPACTLPTGTTVVTLAWSQYVVADPDHPTTVTVTYLTQVSGTREKLLRIRCTGSSVNSTIILADNLTANPTIACPGAASGCTGAGANVPTTITMALATNDPAGHDATAYSATLTGERRTT